MAVAAACRNGWFCGLADQRRTRKRSLVVLVGRGSLDCQHCPGSQCRSCPSRQNRYRPTGGNGAPKRRLKALGGVRGWRVLQRRVGLLRPCLDSEEVPFFTLTEPPAGHRRTTPTHPAGASVPRRWTTSARLPLLLLPALPTVVNQRRVPFREEVPTTRSMLRGLARLPCA